MKKIAIIVTLFCSLMVGLMVPADTYAGEFNTDCNNRFLGLPTWYVGLTNDDCEVEVKEGGGQAGEEDIKQFVWTIVANVVALVMGLVGYLAIGFVIFGGFQYLTSSGDPGRAAKGKKTITNALVGTVICLLASAASSAVSGVISGAVKGAADAGAFFSNLLNTVFVWAGILCVIMIVIAGIEYAISIGNPGRVSKAKNTIMYAAVGLVIIIAAAAIVNFVVGAV